MMRGVGWGRARKASLTDKEKEDEEAQLSHAGLEGAAEDLQALAVPAQLENAEDTHEPNDPEDGQRHGLVGALVLRRDGRAQYVRGVLLLGDDGGERDEVRNDGDDVDDVHDVPEEVELVGARQEAHGQLEREPDDADGLDEEERVGDLRHLVLLDLGAVGRGVEHLVVLELGQRLQTEDDDRQQDDEHRDDGDDARRLRRLRILEQQPHVALELVRRQRLLLLLDEALVLAELVDGELAQLVEFDLLGEDVQRHIDGTAEAAAALVVVEDGVEGGPVAVEEVLIAQRVEVADAARGIAQQRVGELVQRAQLRLEPQPAHVDHDPLAEVVVVRDGLEVGDAGELGVGGVPVLFLAAELGQRPKTHTRAISKVSICNPWSPNPQPN